MLKIFSTFTGIGSPEMALRNLGIDYEVVGISEVDRNALVAYDMIHSDRSIEIETKEKEEMIQEIKDMNVSYDFSTGKSEIPRAKKKLEDLYIANIRTKNYGDIRVIKTEEIPDFDLLTYSFPCKNISLAGKRNGFEKGSETQSSLLWECERIIKDKKPKYLLMENVKNLVGKTNMPHFKDWLKILEDLGYHNEWEVLNGCDFGVPQNRERVMMFSILKEEHKGQKMPKGERTNVSVKDLLEDDKDVAEKLFYLPHQFDTIKRLSKEQDFKKAVPVGCIDNKDNFHSTKFYDAKGYSPTLDSMNGGNRQPKMLYNNNKTCRRLTPLECWRLMGYSDEDFKKAQEKLPNTKLYERAGRGIVIPMLEAIFRNFLLEEK